MTTLTQANRSQQHQAGPTSTSLLDAEFSRLVRPLGASQIHAEGFNKDNSILVGQNAEIKAIAAGLAQLMGHKS